MTVATVYTGGIAHPFEDASPALGRVLEQVGFFPRISNELDEVLDWLQSDRDALLVVYALRWTMTQGEKYAPHRERWALDLSAPERDAISGHVAAGAGLLGVHTASICFDTWSEWRNVLGGMWQWGKSWHPELGPVHVKVDPAHFMTRGLSDFTVNDEAYSDLDLAPGLEIAAHAAAERPGLRPGAEALQRTGQQPALWLHRHGKGRVVYDSLGHDATSIEHPVHRRLLQRAALWASGRAENTLETV